MKSFTRVTVFLICGKSPLEGLGGGYARYASSLAFILKRLGCHVYILCLGKSNKTTKTPFGEVVSVAAPFANVRITALPFLPLVFFILAQKIKSLARQNAFYPIIVWGIGPWGFVGALLRKQLGDVITTINSVFTTLKHEWNVASKAVAISDYGILLAFKYRLINRIFIPLLSLFEHYALNTTQAIVTNYHSTETVLHHELPSVIQRFYRIRFWIDIRQRVSQSKLKMQYKLPKKFILCLSRQDPRKGINILLHAMTILKERRKSVPLLIIGAGELLEANKKLAHKLGVARLVKFFGYISDPYPIMRQASVFCLPTLEEGAGALVINEAMALGLPIITTSCDGIPEDIMQGKTGILVAPGNPRALADGLELLLADSQKARALGKNARKRWLKFYTFSAMSRNCRRLLTRLLQNPNKVG